MTDEKTRPYYIPLQSHINIYIYIYFNSMISYFFVLIPIDFTSVWHKTIRYIQNTKQEMRCIFLEWNKTYSNSRILTITTELHHFHSSNSLFLFTYCYLFRLPYRRHSTYKIFLQSKRHNWILKLHRHHSVSKSIPVWIVVLWVMPWSVLFLIRELLHHCILFQVCCTLFDSRDRIVCLIQLPFLKIATNHKMYLERMIWTLTMTEIEGISFILLKFWSTVLKITGNLATIQLKENV